MICSLNKPRWFLSKFSPVIRKILIQIISACFSCQLWLIKPTNNSQECFENGMNSSFLWYTLFLFSCQKQGPKLEYFPLFLGHPRFVILGWVFLWRKWTSFLNFRGTKYEQWSELSEMARTLIKKMRPQKIKYFFKVHSLLSIAHWASTWIYCKRNGS